MKVFSFDYLKRGLCLFLCTTLVLVACSRSRELPIKASDDYLILLSTDNNRVLAVDPSNPNNTIEVTDTFANLFAKNVGPWSPSGKLSLFVGIDANNREIYKLDTTTNVINLTNNPSGDYSPSWSPDESKIAFVSERDYRRLDVIPTEGGCNQCELYVMNMDGTAQQRLTQHKGSVGRAFWLNAQNLIYGLATDGGSRYGGSEEIFKLNIFNASATQITDSPAAYNRIQQVSRDGKLILFSSNRDGDDELYVMNSDGTEQTRLTTEPGSEIDVSISPDNQIIVWSHLGDQAGIRIMNVKSKTIQQLPDLCNPILSTTDLQVAVIANCNVRNITEKASRDYIYVMDFDGSIRTRIPVPANANATRLITWVSKDWRKFLTQPRKPA